MANYLAIGFVSIVALAAQPVQGERVSAYVETSIASPVLEIGNIDGDWSSVDDGRMIQGFARIGSAWNVTSQWALSVERRAAYIVHFSEDTARFYSALENNQIETGDYPLSLSVEAVKANGVGLSRVWLLGHVSTLKLSINVYEGMRVQSGELTGLGSVGTDGSVRYDYKIDYGYDENRLLDGARTSVNGWGHGLDIHYQANLHRWSLNLAFNDVFHRYYWKAARDEGCISRPLRPDCSVQSLDSTWDQRLPTRSEAEVRYHLSRDLDKSAPSFVYEWQKWGRQEANYIGLSQDDFLLQFEPVKKIIGFSYQSDWVRVKWRFDEVRPTKARYWQLNANFSWPMI